MDKFGTSSPAFSSAGPPFYQIRLQVCSRRPSHPTLRLNPDKRIRCCRPLGPPSILSNPKNKLPPLPFVDFPLHMRVSWLCRLDSPQKLPVFLGYSNYILFSAPFVENFSSFFLVLGTHMREVRLLNYNWVESRWLQVDLQHLLEQDFILILNLLVLVLLLYSFLNVVFKDLVGPRRLGVCLRP